MIRPSRRQHRDTPSEAVALRLHVRIARRGEWNQRLWRGSLGALLGSVVSVALGVPLVWQGAALVVGLAAGLALPAPGHAQRALRYVRRRAGLSYETALQPGTGPDPYGFRALVRRRAVHAVRGVTPPERAPWWLPALAVAVGLLLLPLAGGGLRPQGAPEVGSLPPDSAGGDTLPAETPTAPALPSSAPDRVAQPDGANAAPAAGADAPAAQAPDAGGNDAQTLSRYLDSLRQRPSGDAGAAATAAPENLAPRAGPGQEGASGDPQGRGAGDSAPPSGDAGPSGGQQDGGGSPQDGSPEAGAGGDESGAQGAPDGAQGENPGGAGEPQQQPGEGPQGGGTKAGDGAPGKVEAGALPGDEGGPGTGEAGNLPGESAAAGPGVEGQTAPPEFLEGVLRNGPDNPGGAIRLPGSGDVTLPAGSSVEGYRRAAEQAVTEGNVPLEYQEVIRRYFR